MSKFIALCEKVESFLREQNPDVNAAPVVAQEPADPTMGGETPPTEIATDSTSMHIATNDQIKDMVLNLAEYLENNLNDSDPLRKKLKELSATVNNSDEKVKAVVDEIISVVSPKVENPNVPVPPAEVGGKSTFN